MLPEFNSSGLSIYGVINSDNAIFPIRNTSDIDDADTVVLNYERDDSTTVEPSCGIALVLLQWLGNTANTLVKIDDVRSTDNCYELIRCFYGIGLSLKTADYDIGRLQSGDDPNTIDGSAPFDNNICECANQLGQESASCYFESHPHSNDGSKCTNYLFSSPYQSWRGQSVDMNMQTFVRGGFDSFGIFWPGQNGFGEFELYKDGNPNITRAQVSTNYSLSTSMGKQMSGTEKFQCSLETQCQPSLQCGTVGSSIATGLGAKISILQWPLLAMISLVNINQQLKNQYDEIAKATIQDTLRSFDVKVFYPQPKNHFALSNILQGLTSAFAILAGFVPGVEGVALATSSAAVGAVGAYLGRYIDSNSNSTMDPNPAQEKFADTIVVIYDALLDGLDHLAKDIFRGDDVLRDFNDSTLRSQYPSGFGLLEMMKNGTWVDDSVLPNLTNSREQLAIEILSRGIDDLWKTPSHNKIFVTFQDLKDTKGSTANCMADSSGPPSFKYCDDNGVYYAYNFVEDGPGQGHLDWPWGAKMLNTSFKIDASVRHSFAPVFTERSSNHM